MKKFISNFVVGVSVALFVWVSCSFINTNICNDPMGKHYGDFAKWNVFTILFD